MADKDDQKIPSCDDLPVTGSTTEHTLEVAGRPVKYRAIAEWITLRKVHKPVAQLFHTAYLVDCDDPVSRPITFVFNGGPGAASAYLHMGALGPQRVAFGSSGSLPPPPVNIVDNLETWLAFTDLVFIDPIGTGFSRSLLSKKSQEDKGDDAAKGAASATAPKENPEYWEIDKDIDSLGEFITRFLSAHHRWTSPTFIAGESYGGFRVAKMARSLQQDHGVGLCGALLISPAIEFDSLLGSDYNLTCWVELFPSLVAAAFHHGRARELGQEATIEGALRLGEEFARGELTRWLVSGDALAAKERQQTVATMASMTGLDPLLIERTGGRITPDLFCRELLRSQRRLCGRYDASVTTVDPYPDRNDYEGPDPTLFSIERLFAGAINHHLRTNLKTETDLQYRLLSMAVNESWKDGSKDHVFRKVVGAMDDLRYGMSLNEHMKVFICHGRFDLITPYFSSNRLVEMMKLTPDQREKLLTRHYDGGHMFYSWDESRVAFRDDVRQFYDGAIHQ